MATWCLRYFFYFYYISTFRFLCIKSSKFAHTLLEKLIPISNNHLAKRCKYWEIYSNWEVTRISSCYYKMFRNEYIHIKINMYLHNNCIIFVKQKTNIFLVLLTNKNDKIVTFTWILLDSKDKRTTLKQKKHIYIFVRNKIWGGSYAIHVYKWV